MLHNQYNLQFRTLNKNNLTNQLHVLKVEKVIHNNIIDLQQKNIPSKNLKLIDTIVFMTHHDKYGIT